MQDVLTKSVSQVYHFEDKKQNHIMKKANKEDIVTNIKEKKVEKSGFGPNSLDRNLTFLLSKPELKSEK